MTAFKRTRRLGRQPLSSFIKFATLVQSSNAWRNLDVEGDSVWPEAQSIYNVAALAFYRRGVEEVFTNSTVQSSSHATQAIATTYWAEDSSLVPDAQIFGVDRVVVPNAAEFFSVAWLKPPDNALGGNSSKFPYPEQWFRLVAHTSI